jgi:serine/threonine protein phosphatase PrpC
MGGPLLANGKRWRWAAASRIGTAHLKNQTRKQDAYSVAAMPGGGHCFVVSDGAGTASHGGQGASVVCRTMITRARAWFATSDALPGEEPINAWIDDLRDALTALAERHGIPRRSFAATLVMLVVKDAEILALQIGDSALVGRRDGTWEAICWPENGEFASTTYFVTDDPAVRLKIVRLPLEHDAFALFSDGIETIAL